MKPVLTCLLFCLLLSCSRNPVDLPGFDEAMWQEDTKGCNGQRIKMVKELSEVRENLKGLRQGQLIALLGKPDRQELYKRNQKYFYYQVSPDISCNAPETVEHTIYLSIKFNATGLSNEVIIMNYMP